MNKTILFLISLMTLATVVLSKQTIPHQFSDKDCTICHSTNGPGTKVSGDITGKCMTCHTNLYDEGYMHPVGVKPIRVKVPLDMPLSSEGLLTCITCHDPHTSYETPFGRKSGFLRRIEKGKAFCDVCHMNGLSNSAGHHEVFRNAHFKEKSSPSNEILHIDDMSRDCISCHDGSMGSSVNLRAGDWSHSNDFLQFDQGGKHPIGMNYEKVRMKHPKNMLKPFEMVDKRIHFFNKGCIGCGSCHDPYSIKNKKLIIENTRSALCFACHKNGSR